MQIGHLFQGRFKSIHIDSNRYLLHLSAYINLNNKVHILGGPTAKLWRSSWAEYLKDVSDEICDTGVVLEQFLTNEEYAQFAQEAAAGMREKKLDEEQILQFLAE